MSSGAQTAYLTADEIKVIQSVLEKDILVTCGQQRLKMWARSSSSSSLLTE